LLRIILTAPERGTKDVSGGNDAEEMIVRINHDQPVHAVLRHHLRGRF